MDQIKTEGLDNLWANLQDMSFFGRPVLYQLMAIPLIDLLGRSMDSGLVLNLLFQVLLLWSVFQIGKIISGPWAGVLAAWLAAVFPPLIQLVELFKPYYAEDACIVFSVWLLLLLLRERTIKNARRFVLSLGLGTLIHPFFVLTLFIPIAVLVFYLIFFQEEPRKPTSLKKLGQWVWTKLKDQLVVRGILLPLFVVGLVVASWYVTAGLNLLNIMATVNSNELAGYRGFEIFANGFPDVPRGFFWYLLTMPYGISYVFTVLFLIGIVAALIKHRFRDWFLIVTFVGMYIYIASIATLAWRYFAQLLPIVALISVVWITELKWVWLRTALIGLVLLSGILVYSFVAWGVNQSTKNIARWLGAPLNNNGKCRYFGQIFCPVPPSEDDWKIPEMLKAIENDPDCRPGKCSVLVLTASGTGYSPYAFAYYKVTGFPHAPMTFPIMREFTYEIISFDYEILLQSQYIVFVDIRRKNSSYNGLAINFVQHPTTRFASSHQKIAQIDEPGNLTAYLLKRTAPLTIAEAQDVIRSIDLDQKYKFGQYQVLASLYARAGNFEKALETYRKAINYEPNDPQLYFGLAGSYAALGQSHEAIDAYLKVIELTPGSDVAIQAQTWLDAHQK